MNVRSKKKESGVKSFFKNLFNSSEIDETQETLLETKSQLSKNKGTLTGLASTTGNMAATSGETVDLTRQLLELTQGKHEPRKKKTPHELELEKRAERDASTHKTSAQTEREQDKKNRLAQNRQEAERKLKSLETPEKKQQWDQKIKKTQQTIDDTKKEIFHKFETEVAPKQENASDLQATIQHAKGLDNFKKRPAKDKSSRCCWPFSLFCGPSTLSKQSHAPETESFLREGQYKKVGKSFK